MKRIIWQWTALACLAQLGLGAASAGEQPLLLQEDGKPDRKCVLLKAWTQPDGSTARNVRDVATGELLTVYEKLPAPEPAPLAVAAPVPVAPPVAPVAPPLPVAPPEPTVAAPTLPTAPVPHAPIMVTAPPAPMPVFTTPPTPVPVTMTTAAPAPLPTRAAAPAPIAPPKQLSPEEIVQSKYQHALVEGLRPSEREEAAEMLSALPHVGPTSITALVTAARQDPAASVRACCVRSLRQINCTDPSYQLALRALRNDADAGVRGEVEKALEQAAK
jgi:hypothetical protein